MVIRLVGTNEIEACSLLNSCGMSTTTDLEDAARKVVAAARG
jgi:succinyl-CoA synthetase beta subunit